MYDEGVTTLSYASPGDTRPRGRRMRKLARSLVAPAVLAALLSSFGLTVRTTTSRMDAVTGSMTWQSTWLNRVKFAPSVQVSPLESRLRAANIPYTPRSAFLHTTYHNPFGMILGHGCGSAPPIYRLHPVIGEFASASTDDELREFVRVMQSGTNIEQKSAVDAACEKGLRSLAAARR